MEDQEGRRRQSSNFLDILNDPIKYQEQVRNFMQENCLTEENDQMSSGSSYFQHQSSYLFDKMHSQASPDFINDHAYVFTTQQEPKSYPPVAERQQSYLSVVERQFSEPEWTEPRLIKVESVQKMKSPLQRKFQDYDNLPIQQTPLLYQSHLQQSVLIQTQPQQQLNPTVQDKTTDLYQTSEEPKIAQFGAFQTYLKKDTHEQKTPLSIEEIAQTYNLALTYDSLEGYEHLSNETLQDLLGHTLVLARDQGGCRFLQKLILDKDKALIKIIFDQSIKMFFQLMMDPFGNYMAQKLVEVADDNMLSKIIQTVEEDPVELCKNMHGTRSIQKIIEIVTKPKHISLLRDLLAPKIQPLSREINGNHVIQKMLHHDGWNSQHKQFIYDAMEAQCAIIACHKHGCCVMQKCVDNASQKQLDSLAMKIAKHTRIFVKDPFANYVIQYVLDLKMLDINKEIGVQLLGSLLSLSREKFSSNVIEKCLEQTSDDIKSLMVAEIMEAEYFVEYLADQYGNYVIQKALQVAVEPALGQFLDKLRPQMQALSQYSQFGAKIYNRLAKQYPKLEFRSQGQRAKVEEQRWRQDDNHLQQYANTTKGPKQRQTNQPYSSKNGKQQQKKPFNSKEKQIGSDRVNINISINAPQPGGFPPQQFFTAQPMFPYHGQFAQPQQMHQYYPGQAFSQFPFYKQ